MSTNQPNNEESLCSEVRELRETVEKLRQAAEERNRQEEERYEREYKHVCMNCGKRCRSFWEVLTHTCRR